MQVAATLGDVIFERYAGARVARWAGMRSFVLCLFLAACTEHGQTPGGPVPDPDLMDPDDPPDRCGCVSDPNLPTDDFCCDSTTCFFDDETHQWQIVICEPPLDECLFCTADQICVQSFDGLCTGGSRCVDKVVECPGNACSPECEAAYCNAPTQCQNSIPCGTESPLAFHCYGP